jgi:single-strand DNA-binding protein
MFSGYVGKDVAVIVLPNARNACNCSIAVSKKYKDREGNLKEKLAWVQLKAYGPMAERMGELFTKGKWVFVETEYSPRTWTDAEGKERFVAEFEVLEFDLGPRQASGGETTTRQADEKLSSSPQANGGRSVPKAQQQSTPQQRQTSHLPAERSQSDDSILPDNDQIDW